MTGYKLIIFFTIWYSVMLFWSFHLYRQIKNGDAGRSGTDLFRKNNPIRFWVRTSWDVIWFLVFITIPILMVIQQK